MKIVKRLHRYFYEYPISIAYGYGKIPWTPPWMDNKYVDGCGHGYRLDLLCSSIPVSLPYLVGGVLDPWRL
jgi:hypothetical protein